MIRKLCWLQIVIAFLAVVLVIYDEETFLVTGPSLTLLGFLMAWAALARTWRDLLIFALASPFLVGIICAVIAFFAMGPNDARSTLLVLLSANAIALSAAMFRLKNTQPAPVSGMNLRFGLIHLLGAITTVCLLLSLFRVLSGERFTMVFAAYCMVDWAIVATLVFLFLYKAKSA